MPLHTLGQQTHSPRAEVLLAVERPTGTCSAGGDLEIVDVDHGGDFLLPLYLLGVWLLLFGAAQKSRLEVFGVCLALHFFSFPEGETLASVQQGGDTAVGLHDLSNEHNPLFKAAEHLLGPFCLKFCLPSGTG